MIKLLRSKIAVGLIILFLIFVIGVIGFRFFSGYTWVDAIYMTIITITTVGFGEVQPLSAGQKVFTSILIVSSIFIVGYTIKVISEYIVSQHSRENLKQKRVKSKIHSLTDHVIVCGFGRNGQMAAQKLIAYGMQAVIIEKDEEIFDKSASEDLLMVHGNATEDEVLIEAGIERASTLICALPRDADNLFIVLSAKQLNPDLKIVSRASEESSFDKLKLAGADNIVLPDKIGGEHMAYLVVSPDLVEFLDNLAVSGQRERINVEQVSFEQICTDGVERPIHQLDLRKRTGCSIIGYKTPKGDYLVNPEPETILKKESKLIIIGRPEQIELLKTEYNVL